MRQVLRAGLIVAVGVLVGCKFQVVPRAVEPQAQGKIAGTFKFERRWQGTDLTTGGGCLVFQNAAPLACDGGAFCQANKPAGAGYGYCLSKSVSVWGAQGKGPQQCWWQSTPASCLRKSVLDPLIVGTTYETPEIPAKPPGTKAVVRWRVLTCTNIKQGACADVNAKDGVDRMYLAGPIRSN